MKCPRCGAYNQQGATFCDLCLHGFGQEPSEAPPQATTTVPTESPVGLSSTYSYGAAPSLPQDEQQLPPDASSPPPGNHPGAFHRSRGPQPGAAERSTATKRIYLSLIIVIVLLIAGIFGYKYLLTGQRHNSNPKNLSVLFIGNSYTYVNDLPATISKISQSLGNRLDYAMSAIGGYTLKQHASNQDTISKIKSKEWDFVVLQEQSQIPAVYSDAEKDEFIMPYARELDSIIHEANPSARTVFFETWGRKNGDSEFSFRIPEVGDYNGDQARINSTYEQLSLGLSATLAPVGKAWSLVRKSHPEIELYQGDGSHPSAQGTYLAACIIYDILFNDRVSGASYLTLDPSQAKVLQETADQTIYPQVNQNK